MQAWTGSSRGHSKAACVTVGALAAGRSEGFWVGAVAIAGGSSQQVEDSVHLGFHGTELAFRLALHAVHLALQLALDLIHLTIQLALDGIHLHRTKGSIQPTVTMNSILAASQVSIISSDSV
jgi:hypothetical protein